MTLYAYCFISSLLQPSYLHNEVLHTWRQPTVLYSVAIPYSIVAAVQGWDQSGSNGANLSWQDDFGNPDAAPKIGPLSGMDYDKNSRVVGVVNSGPCFGFAFM